MSVTSTNRVYLVTDNESLNNQLTQNSNTITFFTTLNDAKTFFQNLNTPQKWKIIPIDTQEINLSPMERIKMMMNTNNNPQPS